MAYFNDNGKILWYDQEQIAEGYGDGLTELTEVEAMAAIEANNPAPTIQEQIEALEATITPRNYREALLGDQFAIDKITQIESDIVTLRSQL